MSNDQKTDKNKTIQPTAYKYFQLSLREWVWVWMWVLFMRQTCKQPQGSECGTRQQQTSICISLPLSLSLSHTQCTVNGVTVN